MTRARMRASVVGVLVIVPAAAGLIAVGAASGTTPAHTYFMAPSPTGSDGGSGTSSSPWATFARAFQTVRAGDELVLMDGVYHDSLAPPSSLNGTATAPIYIHAQHDGQARINGDAQRAPINLTGNDYFDIEGLVAYNAGWYQRSDGSKLPYNVVSIGMASSTNWASHETLRRVSAYNVGVTCTSSENPGDCNAHILELYGADHVLIEDCVAAGRGRTIADAMQTDHVTIRRCWFRGDLGTGWNGSDRPGGVTIYNSSYARMENNVFGDASPKGYAYGFGQHDWDNWYGGPEDPTCRDGDPTNDAAQCSNPNIADQINKANVYEGNVVLGANNDPMGTSVTQCKLSRNHVYRNNVVVQQSTDSGASRRGVSNRGATNQLFDHMTLIGNTAGTSGDWQQGFWMSMSSYTKQAWNPSSNTYGSANCSPLNPPTGSNGQNYGAWGFYSYPDGVTPTNHAGFDFTAALQNSVIQGFRVSTQADANAEATPHLTLTDNSAGTLNFDTATYGRGAYLMGATNAPKGSDGTPIGARVLYETVDGVLTNTPLWPWPMEKRVWSETGDPQYWEGANVIFTSRFQESPTWSIWKTLNGVYSSGPGGTTTSTSTSTTTTSTTRTSTTTTSTTTTTTVPRTTTTTLPARFHLGDTVRTTRGVLVYAAPALDARVLGKHRKGDRGTIIGPVRADGHTWWLVDFRGGKDGFVLDEYLRLG